MPLDPNDYDAKLGYQEDGWYGVATSNEDVPGTFYVRRLGGYEHAQQVANAMDRVPVVLGPPRSNGRGSLILLPPATGKHDIVYPMVGSDDMGKTWVFVATGWEVPI